MLVILSFVLNEHFQESAGQFASSRRDDYEEDYSYQENVKKYLEKKKKRHHPYHDEIDLEAVIEELDGENLDDYSDYTYDYAEYSAANRPEKPPDQNGWGSTPVTNEVMRRDEMVRREMVMRRREVMRRRAEVVRQRAVLGRLQALSRAASLQRAQVQVCFVM